jgi:hypothetical protein
MCIQIHPRLVELQPMGGDECSWTLARVAGDMLRLAEAQYGPRDCRYTFLGVEFSDDGPQQCFPGNRGHVVIQLTTGCLLEPDWACYQLAHEVIHLLAPTGRRTEMVLEEGLATHFQTWYMQNEYAKLGWPQPRYPIQCDTPSYLNAEKLVSQLLKAASPGAIANLRQRQPTISAITAQLIQATFPAVQTDLAEALTEAFAR